MPGVGFPYDVMEKLSDPIAILGPDSVVVYANTRFQNLYNPLKDPAKKKPCPELAKLNLHVRESGRAKPSPSGWY